MPERLWILNDVYLTDLAQNFEPPPLPWVFLWWGPPVSMQMSLDTGQVTTLAMNKTMSCNGFFGPKG